jgi:hypothetical protein
MHVPGRPVSKVAPPTPPSPFYISDISDFGTQPGEFHRIFDLQSSLEQIADVEKALGTAKLFCKVRDRDPPQRTRLLTEGSVPGRRRP